MRALVIVALIAATARADDTTPVGFDHRIHDRQIMIGGGTPLPCARCHVEKAGKLVGKPDHKTCFGDCHGAAPPAGRAGTKPEVGDRIKVCSACHAPKALDAPFRGMLAVAYPPYSIDRDWTTTFGHRRHKDVACVACHAGGPRPASGHTRCLGCHDASGAAGHAAGMAACTTCHTPGSGTPLPPRLDDHPIQVKPAFSHTKHAARSAAGKQCTTCHAALADTDGDVLPPPTVETCATCHDGKAAFSVITACTKCHRDPPTKSWTVARPDDRFVHAGPHDKLVQSMPCSGCHPLSPHGEALVTGHQACVPCHTDQLLGGVKLRMCGACHNSTEPWRQLTVDRRPPDHTEFGANLDHAKHRAACTSCHVVTTSLQQLRPSRGHASCSATGCHAIATGPAPRLADCTGCHALGLVGDREAARAKTPWSTRERFDHKSHSVPACGSCHTDQDMTGPVALLHTPPKATCAPCHNGEAAFDLTGTACRRCHGGKAP
jgi:c(7)-type cytochrome triheme protein